MKAVMVLMLQLTASSASVTDLLNIIRTAGEKWAEHCIALERSEEALNERLATSRVDHEMKRQALEADISTKVDSLRQAPTSIALAQIKAQISEKLAVVASSLQAQSDDALTIVRQYPNMAMAIISVCTACSRYCRSSRFHPFAYLVVSVSVNLVLMS